MARNLDDLQFTEMPISELVGPLELCVTPQEPLETLENYLVYLNDSSKILSDEEFTLIKRITIIYVQYASPPSVPDSAVVSLGGYLFFWFVLNTRKTTRELLSTAECFVDELTTGSGSGPYSATIKEIQAGWEGWPNLRRFIDNFESMVCAMAWELENWSRHDHPFDYYDQIRTHSIGTQAWFDAWRGIRGLGTPLHRGTEIRRLEYLGRKAQYLANDLCSLGRDLRKGGSSSILVHHHTKALTLSAAIRQIEALHDATLDEIVSLVESIESAPDIPEAEVWYANFVASCTAGNAQAMALAPEYYRRLRVE
ncbi:hypothetical protein G6O69_23100 [Pseudenhygromyxa sp. WMMC2535]|uniref:terpene synthase family protein n=1 Tax=Pseudenhygromyxa sp. WMMC2535 TaxID=2712867 RepID=UPI0015542948|nr:hypothetical protein [Pseudenhygromyxa sp. WMMC2535]NVB40746.1 hypothetical protein [Pseudenhygromyxa sp. WMMC2535]